LGQILCVTCDNASNNEKMTRHLESLLPDYSSTNRARCFTHILNLVAKSLLKQFDVCKTSKADEELNEEEAELLNLAGDLDAEDLTTTQESDGDQGIEGENLAEDLTTTQESDGDQGIEGENLAEDDLEDWVDEVAALTPGERETLEEDIRPVKMALVKVSHNI
jgi:hypothetical protein